MKLMRGIWLTALLLGLAACGIFSEPRGSRDCECELMDQWAGELPITRQGDVLGADNVNTAEDWDGFGVGGSRNEPAGFDRRIVEETLTRAGFNMRVDRDDVDFWNVAFFPGQSQGVSPWSIEFTETEGRVGFQVGVRVDGSPWGLETIDDLWDSYQDDYESALNAQEERLREAIAKLKDLEAALKSMVVGQN